MKLYITLTQNLQEQGADEIAAQDELDFITKFKQLEPIRNNATRKELELNETARPKKPQALSLITPDIRSELEARLISQKYLKMLETRKELPVYAMRSQIMRTINQNRVLVLSGETGSGKSTQIPHFILHDAIISNAKSCNIICTQPRRISAVSLAERVSQEMADPGDTGSPGSWTGYQVRLENQVSKQTKLTFCTTGILLRRLESDPFLEGITHVIVDEVHERTLDSDFLVYHLRELVHTTNLRIVLMSATADAELFASYFSQGEYPVPCLVVPGKTFPVTSSFMEDIVEQTGYNLELHSEFSLKPITHQNKQKFSISGGGGKKYTREVEWEAQAASKTDQDGDATPSLYSDATIDTVSRMDPLKINYDLIVQLLHFIHETTPASDLNCKGSILIFLPGVAEIRILESFLAVETAPRSSIHASPPSWQVLTLHGMLARQEQSKVFKLPPKGFRKIVLSTNVAETGITIPDVVYVIDSVRAREINFDLKRNVKRLADIIISKANLKQRQGRAGRVQPGYSYHLLPTAAYKKLPDQRPPEMVRLPLEELCLRSRTFCSDKESIQSIFSKMPNAPPAKNLENAISLLQLVQALDEKQQLTRLGKFLARLPMDVQLGKMIFYGIALRCLDPILTICAILSLGKSPLLSNSVQGLKFVNDQSDLLTLVNAFNLWKKWERLPYSETSANCVANHLDLTNLGLINESKKQLLKAVRDIISQENVVNAYSSSVPMLQAALSAGLYPNILIHNGPPYLDQKRSLHMPGQLSSISVFSGSTVKSFDTQSLYVYHGIQSKQNLLGGSAFPTVRDLTRIPMVAVALLSGENMHVMVYNFNENSQNSITIDDYLVLRCWSRSASLLHRLRCDLDIIVDKSLLGIFDQEHSLEQLCILVESEVKHWEI